MPRRLKLVAIVLTVATSALLVAGATAGVAASGGNSGASIGERNVLPPVTTSRPVYGGTLKILGSGDIDHLDTCCAYYTTTYEVLRALSRQMVSYPSKAGASIGTTTPVADIANYTINPSSTVFTFKIKQGVDWYTVHGPVQVTSQDEVRGLERLCNPVLPAPPLSYWENNIAGMLSFCSGFQAVKLSSNPPTEIAQVKNYMATHSISGLSTPNSSTLVIRLSHPSSDFINIMALPMSSPVPASIMNYLPGSVQEEKNFPSDGPYRLDAYTPNQSMTLSRNPFWKSGTDSLRHQYWNAIDVTEGQTGTAIQQALQTGAADLEWDTTVPPADVESQYHNPHFLAVYIGGVQYLAFNMSSSADGGALQKPAVREALQYCINRRHIVQVTGGPQVNVAATQILPPQLSGYQQINPYPSANNTGNQAKCKSQLAAAGYPNGLTLTVAYPNNPPAPAQFQALQADFAQAGVTLKSDEQPSQGEYFTYVETPSNRANWDIAYGAWFPDWEGNAAQSFFGPLFDGRLYTNGSTDYGDYNDPVVNHDIDRALSSASLSQSAAIWAATDKYIMTKDPGWIPMLYNALPQYYGTKVKNVIYNSFLGYVDITQTWR
jgi:ABC-type transport system substrate-binding protein